MREKINVFLVGAQKAGTTSLYEWLGQHPDIEAPQEIKDYHFFTNEALFDKGVPQLERFYSADKPVRVHSAVNYLYFYKEAAARIYEYNKEAKIIICLREPVARAISAYKYCVKTLREKKSFSDALRREINGGLESFSEKADLSYIDHGRYIQQIDEYLKYFPLSQIKIILFEDLKDEFQRSDVMKGILEFLGVDPSFEFNYNHLNRSGVPKSSFVAYLVRKSFIKTILSYLLPFSLRRRIGRFVNELNTSNVDIKVDMTPDDIAVLKRMLGDIDFDYYQGLGLDVSSRWRRGR